MNQQQASQRVANAERRYLAAIQAIEGHWEQSGRRIDNLTDTLEREYHLSQRALRAARTRYGTLANRYHWDAIKA